ncbi:hypothetical protein [Plantactinospora sp. CA-290183]|uniref:hypothetical protein n=1 Tax=Plantactinospora sp. CA-290183 TaxID=3240006 RepID=UPI003D89EDBA
MTAKSRIGGGRALSVIGLTLGITLGTVAVVASPAQAMPGNCTRTLTPDYFRVVCTSGSGTYRAGALCRPVGSEFTRLRWTEWVRVGEVALARCLPGLEEVLVDGRVQLRDA